MHQLELAQRLSNEILGQTTKDAAVTLHIGELLNVDKQELLDLLEVLGHKKVKIELLPSNVKCECGYSGPAEIYHKSHMNVLFRCPKCHAVPSVEKGEELELKLE